MKINLHVFKEERITPHEGEVSCTETYFTKKEAKEALKDKYDEEKEYYEKEDVWIATNKEDATLGGDEDETRYELSVYEEPLTLQEKDAYNLIKEWIPEMSNENKLKLILELTKSVKQELSEK